MSARIIEYEPEPVRDNEDEDDIQAAELFFDPELAVLLEKRKTAKEDDGDQDT